MPHCGCRFWKSWCHTISKGSSAADKAVSSTTSKPGTTVRKGHASVHHHDGWALQRAQGCWFWV